jgi:hypothetical protein
MAGGGPGAAAAISRDLAWRGVVTEERLAWAFWPWQRCKARVEPHPDRYGYWGRCELKKHGKDVDHALERGMDTPRWSTRWTA